jgi:hypothetical protein
LVDVEAVMSADAEEHPEIATIAARFSAKAEQSSAASRSSHPERHPASGGPSTSSS